MRVDDWVDGGRRLVKRVVRRFMLCLVNENVLLNDI